MDQNSKAKLFNWQNTHKFDTQIIMLRLQGRKSYLQEFSDENLRDPKYHKWLRDIEIINLICRYEYLKPISFSEIEKLARGLMYSENDCFFAIYSSGNSEFIGTLKLGLIDWHARVANIGIMIGEKEYWGKGIGTDCINSICAYAFDHLSLRKLTAGNLSTNIGMSKCFERLGFQREGVMRQNILVRGEYIDQVLYGLFKNEFKPLKI